MSLNPFENFIERRARSTPVALDLVKTYLGMICKSGCDRVSLKVRNLAVQFYFAGYNSDSVFLANAETCMISQFSFGDLEPLMLDGIEAMQQVIVAWMDSADCKKAMPLIETSRAAALTGVRIPVTLRWPDGGHSRDGHLSHDSGAYAAAKANWVCGIEVSEGKNVVFRYGLTRMSRADAHQGSISLVLKPGTAF